MQPLPGPPSPGAMPGAAKARRGTALMIAVLTLGILIAILFQITYSTQTDARVSRNEETLRVMDDAIESVMFQVWEDLKADGEADAGGDTGGGDAADDLASGLAGAAGDAGAPGGGGPTDSKEDEWARPQRTELNEIRLRILIQDENSKFNLLSLLTEDEDEADKALDRLVRVLEYARGETSAEIDGSTAEAMAQTVLEVMTRRGDQDLPKPNLLSDDEDEPDRGLLLSPRELVAIDSDLFHPDLFRGFRDDGGDVVHSLNAFLTVWTTLSTRSELDAARSQDPGQATPEPEDPDDQGQGQDDSGDGGDGGDDGGSGGLDGLGEGDGSSGQGSAGAAAENAAFAPVNVNTAPLAVLAALLDNRDLPYGFWDEVLEFRNEEDEEVEENEDPPLDEYGEPIIVRKFFHSVDDLSELDGWNEIEPLVQSELENLLTVQSDVFSIYVTARKSAGSDDGSQELADKEALEREETEGSGISRTVRSVVWRRTGENGEVDIVPLVRWEVLDYVPYEVLDFPSEDR